MSAPVGEEVRVMHELDFAKALSTGARASEITESDDSSARPSVIVDTDYCGIDRYLQEKVIGVWAGEEAELPTSSF